MRGFVGPSVLCVVILLVLATPGAADAVDLGRTPPAKPSSGETYTGGGRVGGDTVADAYVIPGLPFTDLGNTCGFANDYDAVCPYEGSTAPDVVYAYTEPSGQVVTVDLCASEYDTKVYVWEGFEGNVIACSDDAACGATGFQSRIEELVLLPGHTYYFVVDGYAAACGDYSFDILFYVPCELECPPLAQEEGEPPCEDGYVDTYNSGCCCGAGFTPIVPDPEGSAVMCAKSCTFLFEGMSYRDTDWFNLQAEGGTVTATCTAEFPVLFILMYGISCGNLQMIYVTGERCEPVTLSWSFEPDDEFYLWAAPSAFQGVPESDYILEVTGVVPPTPSSACCFSWGCDLYPPQACEVNGGIWLGPEIACDPDPCGPAPGACCVSAVCHVTSQVECAQMGGSWAGAGSDCDPDPCVPTPARSSTWGSIKRSYR